VLIGETYVSDAQKLDESYGGERHDELQLPMDLAVGFIDKLDVDVFRRRLTQAYTQIHGSQPLLVFDNHDHRRSWDRYGDGVHNDKIAKLIAVLLLTSKATALLYQGEEIGQRTAPTEPPEHRKDAMGRDGERPPMQWNASNRQAGFSTDPATWLPVSADYAQVNVASELADPDSLLNWYRRLIALRRERAALREGSVAMLDTHNPDVLSYARMAGTRAMVVSLNMTDQPRTAEFDLKAAGIRGGAVKTVMLNDALTMFPGSAHGATLRVQLPAYGAWVADLR